MISRINTPEHLQKLLDCDSTFLCDRELRVQLAHIKLDRLEHRVDDGLNVLEVSVIVSVEEQASRHSCNISPSQLIERGSSRSRILLPLGDKRQKSIRGHRALVCEALNKVLRNLRHHVGRDAVEIFARDGFGTIRNVVEEVTKVLTKLEWNRHTLLSWLASFLFQSKNGGEVILIVFFLNLQSTVRETIRKGVFFLATENSPLLLL